MGFFDNFIYADTYQIEHPDAHLIFRDGSDHYIVKMNTVMHGTLYHKWMCWPNKEVAEFAAKQFTNLYESVYGIA
ncbi:MAG TPA: hypothetical protein VFM18_15020 [Methanosarcina sp.]|nr:hypothetical protein [Methanosarcina sp.]